MNWRKWHIEYDNTKPEGQRWDANPSWLPGALGALAILVMLATCVLLAMPA